MASNIAMANKVADGLQTFGILVKVARATGDVGLSTAAGAGRSVAMSKARVSKAAARCQRIRRLADATPAAKRLWGTGGKPQMKYGEAVQGVAPSEVSRMRAVAVRTVPGVGCMPCASACFDRALSSEADPAFYTRMDQVSLWLQLWRSSTPKEKAQITSVWRYAFKTAWLDGVD